MQATKIMKKQDVMEMLDKIETDYDAQPIGSLISTKEPDGKTAHNVLVLYTDKDLLLPKAETGGNIWMA